MDFELSDVQRKRYDEIVATAGERFADRREGHLNRDAERHDDLPTRVAGRSGGHLTRVASASDDHPTRDDWRTAADMRLTGLCLPVEYGGLGLGALDTALCLEAFGRGCADTGLVFAVAAHLLACAVPIRDFAAEPVRGELLSGLADGALIAANAMTEDDAGSDVGSLAATAGRRGDEYIMDGVKSFASNAPVANLFVTYAVTDPKASFLGVTAFAVPADRAGIDVSGPLAKMGLHGCPAGRVRFAGCAVPVEFRIGAEGQGSAVFQHSMNWERACLPAIYVGVMSEQLRRCVAHAGQRRQFGRRIGDNQAISHLLAIMAQRLAAARLLLYRACWLLDQDDPEHRSAAAMSKISVSEAAVANGLDAIQVFGGAGYLTETGIESGLRDAVPSMIFSGTTQIQREIVVRELGLG
ncbi:MAG TPA: acyl-CoA dehydrogenase family protein [Pseudonocardiaceae bacterium]|nr:acyl-CoA dehydrogenase family protein [Pseudonocardiaceae bacterium]